SRSHDNRNSFIASPGSATTLSRGGPHLAVTTATPQPIARAPQIPIAPARRTVLPMPARGFLPRGLSDACPRSAPHRQVTGRHLITLNDSRPFGVYTGTEGSSLCRHSHRNSLVPNYLIAIPTRCWRRARRVPRLGKCTSVPSQESSLQQSRMICAHSSEPCRGDCAPIAAAAYHVTPATHALYPIETSCLKRVDGQDRELVDSK